MEPFVHLHAHTEYSLLDGISRLQDMVERAKALNMPAVAITDHGNMYGAVNFYKAAKSVGIKPIIGCEVYITKGSRFDRKTVNGRRERNKHLILLAETNEGYQNLVKIVSKASTEGFYGKPRVDHDLLEKYSRGLIALSACIEGEIPAAIIADDMEEARKLTQWYIDAFGKENFFLEVQDHGMPEELKAQQGLVALAKEFEIGLVATNDFHYLDQKDAEAHDIKLCISMGRKKNDFDRIKFPNDQFYMKSGDEMADLFSHIPEAISNTILIADRCNVELDFTKHHLPKFDVPKGETAKTYLRKICEERIPYRYGKSFKELEERLNYELGVIEKMGFEDYFLIVWDYVDYAHKHDILVGPGRGSAAGSVVAYLLGITGLDPLKYDLLFERFLNPERISMPDIDIDFCYEKRGKAIEYVTKKYGTDRVAQIITFGTEGARAVIRDVGRVLDIPLSEVNKIAKLIPNELGITLTEALQRKELKDLYESDMQVRELFDISLQLEGIARNSSTHAAGVVIAASPLDDYVPVQASDEIVGITQYDKDNIENLGLLKMDFLGLRTLTVMDTALQLIKANRGIDINLDNIPLDDQKTCELLTSGDTAGVFQLESAGITQLVKDLKPRHFEDLIPLVALYRPGPLGSGMVEDFIDRRHGKKEVTYLDPVLEPILKDTFGVILYQEQVMQIASAMGGFSLGEADLLRRAMGKKKEKEIIQLKGKFIDGCKNNGFESKIAEEVFELILYFAGYGFNKSHSAAYAYIAYQTAYLKAHYYPEFMAATMSSFMANMDKLAYYINECRQHDIQVLGPDVNTSERKFTVQGDKIRFGLGGIKTVGDKPVEEIINERQKNGVYESFESFCKRIPSSSMNKRNLEGLIRCGALDSFEQNRKQLLLTYELVQSLGAQWQKDQAMGAMSLFAEEIPGVTSVEYPNVEDMSLEEKLKDEKEYIGFYMSGHPLENYKAEMTGLFELKNLLENAEEYDGKRITFGGIIAERSDKMTKRNDMMSILKIEDFAGVAQVVLFPKMYQNAINYIAQDMTVKIKGRVDADERSVQIIAEQVEPLRRNLEMVRGVIINIRKKYDTPQASQNLAKLLKSLDGDTPVKMRIEKTRKILNVTKDFYFTPTKENISKIENILGKEAVELL